MTDTSTISPTYQVTIPETLRDKGRWRPGQKLAFIQKGSGLLMIPVPTREEMADLTRGADVSDYRDRNDRY